MRYTFNKSERLKSHKLIERLFEKGKRLKSFPIHMLYLQVDDSFENQYQAAFSAPKRRFKKAVDRNRVKRLMREAYRLNKHILFDKKVENTDTKKFIFMFIYMTDEIKTYKEIHKSMVKLLHEFKDL